jgi:hypothetical protein
VRSSRTDHGKRSRVCFRLELGVAAPARGFTHAVPPRRLPLTAANSRPKQGIKKFAPGIGQKDASRVQNKIHGNTHHSDGEFWRYEASIVYDFGRTHMNEKLNIFVSSVQKELEDERVIVQNLLNTDSFLSAHCSPILYEFEPASPDKALEGCLKSLDGCHVYLLIVAAQYGTLVGKLSITHAEYRRSHPCLGNPTHGDTGHRSAVERTTEKNHRPDSKSRTRYERLVCPPSGCSQGHRPS